MEPGTAGVSLFVEVPARGPVDFPALASCPSAVYHGAKRTIDVVVTTVAIVLTLPLFALLALLVRCSSKGPVLFRQARVGRDGRSFKVLKFRSMCSDAEARLGDPTLYETYVATGYKLPVADETRVTRIGRFLRRSSLDELPQLFNVLRGDMSLVGPRPVVPAELGSYGELVHCYLGVRPGITGMWQVNGRSHVRFPERAHIDEQYFHRQSVLLDLAILARTPGAVLRGDGAY
jgi:lipopolysaccharide/colanic/teichoic acid biosynthesis glycosyltransferase